MYAIVFGRAGTPAPPFCPRPQRGTASRSMTDKLAFTRRVPSSTPQYGRGHETPIREERLTPDKRRCRERPVSQLTAYRHQALDSDGSN